MPDLSAFSLAGQDRGRDRRLARHWRCHRDRPAGCGSYGVRPQPFRDRAAGRDRDCLRSLRRQGDRERVPHRSRRKAAASTHWSTPPASAFRPQSAESELARFRATVATDLTGVYATILAAYPLLKKAGSAAIVNVTSINSMRGFPGNPGYVAAKAGLAGLTRALAADYAPDGIRVNALAPGYVATEMTAKSFADPVMHEARRRHTMLGRWGQPADMVGAAVFLASDASALCDRPGDLRRRRLDRQGPRHQFG